MKREKTLFVVTLIILALMIAAVLIVALRCMKEEAFWDRAPVPAVTDAPDAAQGEPWLEVVTENQPPGRG